MLWLCRDLFIDWYHFSIYINIYKPGCQNRMLTYMQIFRHLISGTNVYFIRRRGWVSSRASSFLLIIAHFLSSGSTNYIQKERFVASQLELNITHNFVSLLIFACNYLVKPNMVANWGVSRLVSCECRRENIFYNFYSAGGETRSQVPPIGFCDDFFH